MWGGAEAARCVPGRPVSCIALGAVVSPMIEQHTIRLRRHAANPDIVCCCLLTRADLIGYYNIYGCLACLWKRGETVPGFVETDRKDEEFAWRNEAASREVSCESVGLSNDTVFCAVRRRD